MLYKAPPVVKGRVPKNVYGNLDIYAPTMVPAGGSHILHPETARAARTLGIDYSDAVTGFSFKGRHGTAVINGAVVATEFREAVQEVLHAFEDEMVDEEAHRRSAEALRFWKRLLTGLRIRERINGYEIEGERKALDEQMRGVDEAENEEDEAENGEDESVGGGFFPDSIAEDIAEPTAVRFGEYSGNHEGADPSTGGSLTEEDLKDVKDVSHGIGAHFADGNGRQHYLRNLNRVEGSRYIPSNLSPDDQSTQEHHNEAEGGGFLDGETFEQHPTQNSSQPTKDLADGNMHKSHTSATQETKKQATSSRPSEQERISTANNYATKASKGPFSDFNLPESELAEARMLQELHEASRNPPPRIISSQAVQSIPLSQPILLHGVSSDDVPIIPRRRGEEEEESVGILKNDDDEGGRNSGSSDAGSLLSHDPDDDDADPEWIA